MTTLEAYNAAKAKWPGREIKVWDWVGEDGKRNVHIDIDEEVFKGDDLETILGSANPPTNEEKRNKARADLLQELDEIQEKLNKLDTL